MARIGSQGRSGTTAHSIRVIAVALRAVPIVMASSYAALGTSASAHIDVLDRARSFNFQPLKARNVIVTQLNAGSLAIPPSLSGSTPVAVTVDPPERPAAAPERPAGANPLWEIPLATMSATRGRPIFSSSRRSPPAVVAVPAADGPPPPPKPVEAEHPLLSLLGTITGDDQGFGIFFDQTTKVALRLKIGEEARGWKLRLVHSREVTLEREQQTVILSMPEPSAGTAVQARVQAEIAGILWGPADLQSVLRESYAPR